MNDKLIQRACKEMVRAGKSLRSAVILLDEECYEDAVSRAYYAVLHAAKAALALQDIRCDSHAGVRRMFGMHFIKTAIIEDEYNKILVAEQEDRELGDYDIDAIIDDSRCRQRVKDAERFLERIRQYLEENGVTASDADREER